MPDDSRIWMLEGEITANGYIYGIYNAHDPIDKGIGNFFLKVNHNRVMHGLWSGYDSVNGKITSGKYTFHPIDSKVSIFGMTESDISQVLDVSDQELGKNYLSDELFKDAIGNPDKYVCKVAKSKTENKIAGFCLSIIVNPAEIVEQFSSYGVKLPRSLLHAEKVGLINTIAIRNNHQGHGVGFESVKNTINSLKEKDIHCFCSIGWKNSKTGKINISNILKTLNFQEIAEIPEFWKKDSEEKGYDCPVCGTPCTCSAVIYSLSL
jgi:ribosomal protein S18 acetylase RimI-like enzyme